MVGLASALHHCLAFSINSIYSGNYNFDDYKTDKFCKIFELRCNKEGSSLSKCSGSETDDESRWIGMVTVEPQVYAQLSDTFALTRIGYWTDVYLSEDIGKIKHRLGHGSAGRVHCFVIFRVVLVSSEQ